MVEKVLVRESFFEDTWNIGSGKRRALDSGGHVSRFETTSLNSELQTQLSLKPLSSSKMGSIFCDLLPAPCGASSNPPLEVQHFNI